MSVRDAEAPDFITETKNTEPSPLLNGPVSFDLFGAGREFNGDAFTDAIEALRSARLEDLELEITGIKRRSKLVLTLARWMRIKLGPYSVSRGGSSLNTYPTGFRAEQAQKTRETNRTLGWHVLRRLATKES